MHYTTCGTIGTYCARPYESIDKNIWMGAFSGTIYLLLLLYYMRNFPNIIGRHVSFLKQMNEFMKSYEEFMNTHPTHTT